VYPHFIVSFQIYKCNNNRCPRPGCYRSCASNKPDVFPCTRPGCSGSFTLQRWDCTGTSTRYCMLLTSPDIHVGYYLFPVCLLYTSSCLCIFLCTSSLVKWTIAKFSSYSGLYFCFHVYNMYPVVMWSKFCTISVSTITSFCCCLVDMYHLWTVLVTISSWQPCWMEQQ